MVVDKDSFTINGKITSYIRTSDSSQKTTSYFCPKCDNSIYGELKKFPDILAVKPGALNDTQWFTVDRYIWTDSAQSWFQFPEDCKPLQRARDNFEKISA